MVKISLWIIRLLLIFAVLSNFFTANTSETVQAFNNLSLSHPSNSGPYDLAAAPTGEWECVGAGLPDPCRNTLNSVDMVSKNSGWAVGDGGTILHWDGISWVKFLTPTTNSLKSVNIVSSLVGWAVGEKGTIIRWNGSRWSEMTSPTTATLWAVGMASAVEGWAVGDNETILHWDGSSWQIYSEGIGNLLSLRAIDIVSASEGWAVGSYGMIMHWDGDNWSDVSSPSGNWLYSVSFLSANQGWAVGEGGYILRYLDGTWSIFDDQADPRIGSSYTVKMISSTDGWILGAPDSVKGSALHWDGNSWTFTQGPTIYNSFSLSLISANEGWAVGEGGQILHYANGNWLVYASPKNTILDSVSMLSVTNGWAVGLDANGTQIMRWDGMSWNVVPKPDDLHLRHLNSINMISDNDGWAGGQYGQILHWDGSIWNVSFSNNGLFDIPSIDWISPDDVWALPLDSSPLHFNGAEWNSIEKPLGVRLVALDMVSADDGWAVGWTDTVDGGVSSVIRWSGTEWISFSAPNVQNLEFISMTSASDGWAGNSGGHLLHWNGDTWNQTTNPTVNGVITIKMVSQTDGWAMGALGLILHWNGTSWDVVPSPTANTLRSISFANDGSLWAVGEYGVTLRNFPTGLLDLFIREASPVQVIENTDLVFDKETAVKVEVNKIGSKAVNNVSVKLDIGNISLDTFYVADDGNIDPFFNEIISDNDGYPLSFTSEEQVKTIYFIDPSLRPLASTYQVSVHVDPANLIAETNESNNSMTSPIRNVFSTQWTTRTGAKITSFDLHYFPVDWTDTKSLQSFADKSSNFIQAIFPVASSNFDWKYDKISTLRSPRSSPKPIYDIQDIADWLGEASLFLRLANPNPDIFIGVVPPNWFSTYTSVNATGAGIPGGSALLIEAEFSVRPNAGGVQFAAHEVGHKYLQFPRDCKEEYFTCNSTIKDGLGNYSGNGFFVNMRIPVSNDNSNKYYCFMGATGYPYPSVWIDSVHYLELFESHKVVINQLQSKLSGNGKIIVVSGSFNIDNSISLDDWFVLDDGELTEISPGPYSFEFLDSTGNIVASIPFSIDFTFYGSEESLSHAPFVFSLPFNPLTQKIRIKQNETVLVERTVSTNSPSVSIIAPNGNEMISDYYDISWTSSDVDGDSIRYALLYSSDNGETWEPLSMNLNETNYHWDVSILEPGNNYLIKVIATDGVNTGNDISSSKFSILKSIYLPIVRR